jgi:nucleoside-diphosphate-sugar epimerase
VAPVVVVTGANGFVGARTCAALVERGATVRAVVRRAGAAPELPGVEERVGDFTDPAFAAEVLAGAEAAVTTVHPMGSDRATQERVGVAGTLAFAEAAGAVGVDRLVHVSTASVYDRSPGVGDVDESAQLVPDDGGDYAVTKRDTDRALEGLDGPRAPTRVLVRPPVILGPGESSIWNTLRPAEIRERPEARRFVPDLTFAWVHVDDLAALLADLAVGAVATAEDPADGPVPCSCTVVNAAAGATSFRAYAETVTAAVDVDPVWADGPAWTGRIVADRARRWGWTPGVDLDRAFAELRGGVGP